MNNKYFASVLLGAAAIIGAYRYSKLTDQEKQEMANSLKEKLSGFKAEAADMASSSKKYYNDFKDKASNIIKQNFPDAEKHFNNFFGKSSGYRR